MGHFLRRYALLRMRKNEKAFCAPPPRPALLAGGHPSPAAMARRPQRGAAVAWTCRSGWVTVEPRGFSGGDGLGTAGCGKLGGEDFERDFKGAKVMRYTAAARTSPTRSRHGSWA